MSLNTPSPHLATSSVFSHDSGFLDFLCYSIAYTTVHFINRFILHFSVRIDNVVLPYMSLKI